MNNPVVPSVISSQRVVQVESGFYTGKNLKTSYQFNKVPEPLLCGRVRGRRGPVKHMHRTRCT